MKLYIDTETYSATPISYGTYRYIQDCEIMLITWAIDDGPVQAVDLTYGTGEGLADVFHAIATADEVIAHNAMFDRGVLAKRFAIPLEKWRCTMVKAMAHSLPGSLDKLCDILKVPQDKAKHKRGKDLIHLFCKPRPKNMKLRRATRETHPSEWAEFVEYAKADIDAMREVDKRLPVWNYQGDELALWHLDQQINDRGFAVDLELANAALTATDDEQDRLASVAQDMTDNAVYRATQRDAMLDYIANEYGILTDDLKGSTVERLLDDDIPEPLKELLRVRLQASTTSTSKYKKLVNGVTKDGRLKGTLQFDGAGRTGRWSGRTFQPQNLPSRGLLPQHEIELGVEALKLGAADLMFDNVMHLVSSAIRGCIIAPQGKKLVVADLSNIEGRMLAWLAGETWKVEAFAEGRDLYVEAYAKGFGIDPSEVTKAQRQIGKVMELGLGYAGGVGAFKTFALAYSIDLEELAVTAKDYLPEDLVREASDFYEWQVGQGRDTYGMSAEAFITCEVFKRAWRYGHPNVVALWREMEETAIAAVENPGTTLSFGKFKVRRDGAWLRIVLPSGRALCYPNPRIEDGQLSYMGINQYTRKWQRIRTYSGKLVENATQAAARDILASAMPAIEAAGYKIILSVHDELLCETPDSDEFTVDALANFMSTNPAWAEGLPLDAAGFEGKRYKKD